MIFHDLTKEATAFSLIEDLAKKDKITGLAIDTETNGADVRDGRGKLIGTSLAWRDTDGMNSIYLPFNHNSNSNFDFEPFKAPLQHILNTKRVIFHNAKFDLVSLGTVGLDTSHTKFFDTMILAHLVDENNPIGGKGLDVLCKYYLKKPGKSKSKEQETIEKLLGWGYVPPEFMSPYAVKDTISTLELFEFLTPKLVQEDLGKIWEHKEKFIRLLVSMEGKGVRIDRKLAIHEADKGEDIMLRIIKDLKGRSPAKTSDLRYMLLDELGLPPIYRNRKRKNGTIEKTITFDKKAMEEYDVILERLNNPLAKKILEYRGWSKAVSASYRPYVKLLSPDGRLRCNYKLHGTRTGRMSCEQPNLQQIPKESGKPWNENMRKVFLGSEGSTLISVDYSQLELRLGAGIAGEDDLKEVFLEGRDLFTEMAQTLGMERQDTKTMVYSIQYGAGIKRVSNALGMSPMEAKKRIDSYYASYPNFRKATQLASHLARRDSKIKYWSGRYRHFDNPEKEDYKAFNSLIQGSAADVVEHVMVNLDKKGFNTNECKMLLQVHDEVAFDINNDIKDEALHGIKEVMADVTDACGIDFGVKFDVSEKAWN